MAWATTSTGHPAEAMSASVSAITWERADSGTQTSVISTSLPGRSAADENNAVLRTLHSSFLSSLPQF